MRFLGLIIYILSFAPIMLDGQNRPNLPESFNYIPLENTPSLTLNGVTLEELVNSEDFFPNVMGKNIPISIDLSTDAKFKDIAIGRVKRFKIKVSNSKAINLYFDKFKLEEGAKLFVYRPDLKQIHGPFTSKNNPASGFFASPEIYGEEVILELFEPTQCESTSEIKIFEVGNLINNVVNPFNFKQSDEAEQECYININCPQGDLWQKEKLGVVRFIIKDGSLTYNCSGSLINNTKEDKTPYLLSAAHCFEDLITSEYDMVITRFNYEGVNCNTYTSTGDTTFIGTYKRAMGTTSNESDFALLELKDKIPETVGVFFNGWDISNTPANSGVVIHHPNGYIKKITVYNKPLTTTSVKGLKPNAFWNVEYSESATFGGSSGSPLFNENGLVIGTLSGGAASCSKLNSPDQYGKITEHWDQNGNTSDKRLMDWLDPTNTGVKNLNGLAFPDDGKPISPKNSDWGLLYSLITKDNLTISVGNKTQIDAKIFDITGKYITYYQFINIQNSTIQVPISSLANGTYILQLSADNESKTQKIVLYR